MTNGNPYSWLSDYLNIEECKENVLRGFLSCYRLRTYKVKHVGFEKEEISDSNLTFYFKTKNVPHDDFFIPKLRLSSASSSRLSSYSSIKSDFFLQSERMEEGRKHRAKIFEDSLPIEIQKLSEYKPSFRTTVLCYDEDYVEYIPIFKEEIEQRMQKTNNEFELAVLQSEDRKGYIDFIATYLLKEHKIFTKNLSDCRDAYRVIYGIMISQLLAALSHIRENYFSDLTDTKISQLNKIFALKEGTKSFHSKISIPHSDMERAIKNLKDTHLIDKDTPVQAFINLFKNVNMSDNKINWTGGKMALCDFIKMIIGSKYISDTNNTHWEITANCFTIDGIHMERKAFLNPKPIKDNQKLKKMDNFLITIGLRMPKKK